MSEQEHDFLKIASALTGTDQKDLLVAAWRSYLATIKPSLEREIKYLAEKRGMTILECHAQVLESKKRSG